MAQLLDTSLFSVVDTDSSIGVGWKLNFYVTATTTRLATYPTEADAIAGTNANANPVVLASDGRLPPIWLGDGQYKCVLTDENDVVKETIDPINEDRELASIVDYGATGNGTTNDYAAIQAAIDTGKDVYLPAGTYKIQTGLVMSTSYQRIYGPGVLKPDGAINALTVNGGAIGNEIELTVNSATHTTEWVVYIANANRVRVKRLNILDAYGGVYVEQANTVSIEWMWATLRGPGIKWFGNNAKRSDILHIQFAVIDHGANLYGLDWDGNCHSLFVKYLGLVCGSSVSAANSYGVIIRNTAAGDPPAIGRFNHVDVDYPGGPGINVSTLTSDLDFANCYVLGATGSGILQAATVNSREVRVHGGKYRGCTRYGIEALGGVVLYSGSADLQSNSLGKTTGNVYTETIYLALDDFSFFYIDSGGDPYWSVDENDYLTYDRSANTFRAFIGAAEKLAWSTTSVSANVPLIMKNYTVATLPAGANYMRAFVSDSNATLTAGIGAVVAGGGANIVPVYYDGSWRIG